MPDTAFPGHKASNGKIMGWIDEAHFCFVSSADKFKKMLVAASLHPTR
jgi:hypothetical protein